MIFSAADQAELNRRDMEDERAAMDHSYQDFPLPASDEDIVAAIERSMVKLSIPSLGVEFYCSPDAVKANAIDMARQYGKAVKVG